MSDRSVNFRFKGEQIEILERLRTRLRADTYAEALRLAINIALCVTSVDRDGYKIVLEKEGEEPQILQVH